MTLRKTSASAKKTRRSRQMRDRKLSSKDLDLLVLAGCSCLLTLLYHPVAEALQTAEIVNKPISSRPSLQVSAQFNRTTFVSAPIYTTLPPKREEIVEEEDEA